jgi:hypothetical protein
MKIIYIGDDKKRDEQFISLFALGIVSAFKEDLITYEDVWDWFFNLGTLFFIESQELNKDIFKAINLGTELGTVKRHIPYAFQSSCDEILDLLRESLKSNTFAIDNRINHFIRLRPGVEDFDTSLDSGSFQ